MSLPFLMSLPTGAAFFSLTGHLFNVINAQRGTAALLRGSHAGHAGSPGAAELPQCALHCVLLHAGVFGLSYQAGATQRQPASAALRSRPPPPPSSFINHRQPGAGERRGHQPAERGAAQPSSACAPEGPPKQKSTDPPCILLNPRPTDFCFLFFF
jgi:hypothetical protein